MTNFAVSATATAFAACFAISTAAPMHQLSGMLGDIVFSKAPQKQVDVQQSSQAVQVDHSMHSMSRHQGGIEDVIGQRRHDIHQGGSMGGLEDIFRSPAVTSQHSSQVDNSVASFSHQTHSSSHHEIAGNQRINTGGLEEILGQHGQSEDATRTHTSDRLSATLHPLYSSPQAVQIAPTTLQRDNKKEKVSSHPPTGAADLLRSVGGIRKKAREAHLKRWQSKHQSYYQKNHAAEVKEKGAGERERRKMPPRPDWMLNFNGHITDLYKVYEKHTKCSRSTSLAQIRQNCTPYLAREMLSGDAEREKNAVKMIGIPEERQLGKRTKYLGDQRDAITETFARHHDISLMQAVFRMDKRLTEPIAKLLKNKETFEMGADMLPALQPRPQKKS